MSAYESYESTSQLYDNARRPIDVAHLVTTIKRVAAQKQTLVRDLSVLDIGCGTGNYIMALTKELNCQFTGMECSDGMIQKFRAKLAAGRTSNVRCVKGNVLERLPFETGSFDVVMASQMLHHLPTTAGDWAGVKHCLLEVARVARRDGSVFWLQTQTAAQHMHGFWWNELIPKASLRLAKKMPGIEWIAGVLKECGMTVTETRTPKETLIAREVYAVLEGPFHESFRSYDSGWSLVSNEELTSAQRYLKEVVLVSEDTAAAFFRRKEREREEFGQTTTLVAVKR
jgi:ubiquinone/menaquinone biosynthesis C-methylase UbiE